MIKYRFILLKISDEAYESSTPTLVVDYIISFFVDEAAVSLLDCQMASQALVLKQGEHTRLIWSLDLSSMHTCIFTIVIDMP